MRTKPNNKHFQSDLRLTFTPVTMGYLFTLFIVDNLFTTASPKSFGTFAPERVNAIYAFTTDAGAWCTVVYVGVTMCTCISHLTFANHCVTRTVFTFNYMGAVLFTQFKGCKETVFV